MAGRSYQVDAENRLAIRAESMLKVALTGNIASGKSTVARVWSSLGAEVVDADELARRAVAPGTPALRAIVDRWGEGILDRGGALDRARLRDIVFRDGDARRELEALVHPEVARLREEEVEQLARRGIEVAVFDIPLLFETGLQDRFDFVVLVDAAESTRRERLVRDRGLAVDAADRMIAAQMPSGLKRSRSDVTIDNDGSLAQLEMRAREVWREIETAAEREAGAS